MQLMEHWGNMAKINVCPGDDLLTFYLSAAVLRQVGRSRLIRTNLTEPDVHLNFS